MRIAFLILAHHMPRHLARLCSALRHPDHRFFIHIDRKSNISQFDQTGDDVVFIEDRVRIELSDFECIKATLRLIRAADSGFDRFFLLSGADYPLYHANEINSFFAKHPDIEFMNAALMPCAAVDKEIERLEQFIPRTMLDRVRKKVLGNRKRDWQKALGPKKPYGGSQWWAITAPAAQDILRGATPAFCGFFRNTRIPNESFFQTLLCNSDLGSRRICRSVHFTDWAEGGHHPAIIEERHIAHLLENPLAWEPAAYGIGTPLVFARKFVEDAAVLDLIDSIPLRPVPTPVWPRGDREPLFTQQ